MRGSLFIIGFAFAFSLLGCTNLSKVVPGFDSVPAKADSASPDLKSNTLFVFDLSNMGKDLVWTVWLERVDGGLYQGLQSGMPSESLFVYLELSADKNFGHLFEKKQNPDDPRGASLIDRFPVVSIDRHDVTFDFSQGLSGRFFSLFIQPKNSTEFNYVYSAVSDFENHDNVVTFTQLLKLKDAKASTAIMHHAFRSANDTNNFKPVKIVQPAKMGIMPASFSGDPELSEPVAIRKWDTRQPITFYISSNTPADYRPAIIEGLRWWNDALGFEFIKVEVLDKPVNWGDARLNIFQWSDDLSVCGSASAIGPSEANPVTGQIYSGKIIFCGNSLFQLYDFGVAPETISRADFMKKLMAWSAAHEMGHVLGFTHNFKGKLYRDKDHPEILNSTVMDYPFPSEIPAYHKVGPADLAKISLSYLHDGDATSVQTLNSFPFCSDEEASYKPDCTSFIPGGMTPAELADRYLKLILNGKPILRMEHGARAVIVKNLFLKGDEAANKDAEQLFRFYPGSDSVLVDDIQNIAEKSQPYFKHLSEANQSFVLKTISDCVSNCPFTFESRKKLLSVIGKSETFVGFTTLQSLDKSLEADIKASTDTQKLTDSYRLSAAVKEFIAYFWH